jgi:hypothetical protein
MRATAQIRNAGPTLATLSRNQETQSVTDVLSHSVTHVLTPNSSLRPLCNQARMPATPYTDANALLAAPGSYTSHRLRDTLE